MILLVNANTHLCQHGFVPTCNLSFGSLILTVTNHKCQVRPQGCTVTPPHEKTPHGWGLLLGCGSGAGGPSFGRLDLYHLFHSIPGILFHRVLNCIDWSGMLGVACCRLCFAQSGLYTASHLRTLILIYSIRLHTDSKMDCWVNEWMHDWMKA